MVAKLDKLEMLHEDLKYFSKRHISYGEKVEVDPSTFKIVDGKVYLFYNKYFNNTLTDWNKNEKVLHTNADKTWATFKHK
jgi:hypothetical protein